MEMPGMVGERRPGEARQTDYITPFTVNARATCFRYDGRVAPQQILRDGEVVAVDRLRLEQYTKHFLICTDETKGVPAGTAGRLERFMQRLTLSVAVLPTEFTRLVPIVFTVVGKRRPYTPCWITGLPLRLEGVTRTDAESVTTVLATTPEEAIVGVAAMAMGKGDKSSLAYTISLFAVGFADYVAAQFAKESTNDLDMHEKRLLVLGPLLNLRKAITGMLTPAEFRALSHSFVTFVIDTYGLDGFLAVMSTKVTNKAREKEDRILKQLELSVASTLQVDLGELEERWKSELLERHKEELMQNQQYRLLPEPMKTVDSFASTAVAAASRTARAEATQTAAMSGGETDRSRHTEEDDEDELQMLITDGSTTENEENAIVMFDADAKPSLPPESPPRELGPESRGGPLRPLSTFRAVRWTMCWVYAHERMAYFKCLLCVLYLAAFAAGFPYALLVLLEDALGEDSVTGESEMADMTTFIIAGGCLVGGLVLQAQAEYVLKRCTPSGARFIPVVQMQLAQHMVAFPQIHLDSCGPADFRRYTVVLERDVPMASKNVDALVVGLASFWQLVGSLAVLALISLPPTVIAALTLPIFYLYSERVARVMASTAVYVREFERKFLEAVDENFSRSALKKTLGLGFYLDGKMEQHVKAVGMGYADLASAAAQSERGMQLLTGLLTTIVLLMGSYLVSLDVLTLGELLAFYVGSTTLGVHIVKLAGCVSQFRGSRASVAQIESVLSQASDSAEDASVVMPQEAGLEITKLTYHGVDAVGELRCLLKDVTLVISPGQKVALVGDIAGSASVLVKLCTRLYKPDSGSISVSQVALSEIHVPKTFAVVDEEPLLFEGTVADNIRIGTRATLEQVEDAAILACIHDEVLELEAGYDSPVGASGERVSLMLRQRLVLARAVCRRTPIILMDQPLSTQDPEMLATIGKSLSTLTFAGPTGGEFATTVLVASNNLDLIQDFDVVAALQDGQVAEYGSPDELVERKGKYWAMFAEKEGLSLNAVSGRSEISVERLRKIWPFAHTQSEGALEVMINNIVTKYCLGRETLHSKGTSADSMMVLIKGTASEYITRNGKETVLRQWQAGDVVGIENLVTSSTSWATNAVSAPGAVVAILKRHFFQKTIDSNLYLRFGVRPVMRQMAYLRSPLFMSMLWPFAGLSNEEMEKVVSCFDTRVYDQGTRLFAGDGCRLMYVVVTGRVLTRFETFTAAFKKTTCQRYLGPGSVLGMGVLAGSQTPDLLSARTTERSIIMTWRDTALETGHLEPYQNSIKGTIESNIERAREYVSVDNLKRSWLLSLVPENVLAVLASVFRLRVVGKGGLILSSEEGAADRPADTCVILVSGSALVSTRLVDGQVAHRVVEQGELINEVALVGNPALLGTDLASVEAQEVCTVATCSQSACVAVLGTLGMVDTVREMAERRNAVQSPEFLRNVGFADASPAGLCVLAHAARAVVLEKSASPYDSLADPTRSDSTVFVILQGRVRVHGGRRGTRDLGPGEHFHRLTTSQSGQATDAYVDSASVASPHAVLFVVDAAHVAAHDRPGTAQETETTAHKVATSEMAAERAKLCDLQDKVHVVEMRLGIRIPPSPRLQWRRAALLVRSALQQQVGDRLFDHLRGCYTVDTCRSVSEEVVYLKAYLHQLNMELNRREEIFLDTVAKFRQMGHTQDDSEVLDDDPFDLRFERIDDLEPQMERLRIQRSARVATQRAELAKLWERMRTPEGVVARIDEALRVFGLQPEVFDILDEEETNVRAIVLKAIIHARNQLRNLWPVLKVAMDKRQPFLPEKEPFPTVEVLDAYEEEVRKLSYAAEVFRPIEFDPVKFHLALQCRGLRDDLGLPPPPDDDPLDRDTEEWDAEVVGLQRALAERNQDRGEVIQQLHDLWALLGTPEEERQALLTHHHSLRADTQLALEAEAEVLKKTLVKQRRVRLKLVRQLRPLWAASGKTMEDQDKFLLRNDNVLPATLQRIKKELDLQRAISDAQQKLKQAMDSYAPYEVRVATEVLHELQLEERAARLQLRAEEMALAAERGGEESADEEQEEDAEETEGETKEMKVVKQMEELTRIRSEKAAKLIAAYMRGFITRRLMKNVRIAMERCRELWEHVGVAEAAMDAQLAAFNGMRLRQRTHELKVLQTRLEAQSKAKEVDEERMRLKQKELKDQKAAFEVFERVCVIWEKLKVKPADPVRQAIQEMMGKPCGEVIGRLKAEERSLKDRLDSEKKLAEEEQSVRQATVAVEKETGKASRSGGGEKKEKKAKKAKGSKKAKKAKKGAEAEVDPEAADAFDPELPEGFKAQPGHGEMLPSGVSASETDMSASEAEDRDFGL